MVATHLITESLRTALVLYGAFALFYLGVPLVARRVGTAAPPAGGAGRC